MRVDHLKYLLQSGIIVAGFCGGTLICEGAAQTFVIDQAKTSITVSGSVAGGALKEQGTGSLTTTFSGKLMVDIGASTIQVVTGSQIAAQTNGSWEPGPGGASGTAPADFGGKATVGFFTAKAALRNLLLDALSAPIPLSNGQFDASGIVFAFSPAGKSTLDYNAVLLTGSQVLTGLATNGVTTKATLAGAANNQTLTIPINATNVFTLLSNGDSYLVLSGQLVATQSSTPSSLELSSVSVKNNTLTLQWPNESGKQYQVESTTDFMSWKVEATGLTGTGAVITWSQTLPGPTGFYRVGMQ
jgi:hypothetical protein